MAFSEPNGGEALDYEAKVRADRSAELASKSAQERAHIAKWDVNIAVFLFLGGAIFIAMVLDFAGPVLIPTLIVIGLCKLKKHNKKVHRNI